MFHPVVVAAFRQSSEAHEAKRLLEDADIASVVVRNGQGLERRCPDLFQDGFDLAVDSEDADAALALLEPAWGDVGKEIRVRESCPNCGSEAIGVVPRLALGVAAVITLTTAGLMAGQQQLFFLLTVIVCGLLLWAPNRWCRRCGERWTGRPVPPPEVEGPDRTSMVCPRCGSDDTGTIDRRREKAASLVVNLIVPPLFYVWPFLKRFRCDRCGFEWR